MPEDVDVDQPKSAATSDADQKILDEAKKRFEVCVESERDMRVLALDDLNFRAGEQWPANIKSQRQDEGKPCLTINVLPARERQILNDQRQNRPSIKVSPVNDEATEDTAEVLQGMVRHIEYDSNADVAYDTAFASAVRSGFGYIRLITEFEDENSFDQVIKIDRVRNAFMVYMDPSCQKADYSDAEFGFIFETLTKKEFKQQYPNAELSSLDDWNSIGDRDPDWLAESGIRVCEYFYKSHKADKLLHIRDGQGNEMAVLESKLPDTMPSDAQIVTERDVDTVTVNWCKHTQKEVLEKTVWPGKWIPLIPVLGDELDVDGKRILEGVVRHAKDPCRMQNFMASAEAQAIGIAPAAPFIAAAGQIEDFYDEWKTANTRMTSVLRYNPISVAGTLVGPPQRQTAEPAVMAITNARQNFANDLRDVTGIYEAQYGARSGEKSGVAIREKQSQGQISNFHYLDNMTRAIHFLGLQIIDLIPKIYSGPRVMRIVGEDGTQKTVKVNQPFDAGGVQKIFDLTAGKYDVAVTSGPSYATKRQDAADNIMQFIKAYPQLAQVTGDLLVKFMDFPGHEELAERLRKTLPPGMIDDDGSDPEIALQATQAKLQALGQQHDQMVQLITKLQDEKNGKVVEQQGRLEVEKLHAETTITVAEISSKAQNELKRAQFEFDMWKILHGSAHDAASQAMDAQNQQAQQGQDQQHELGMQQDQQAQDENMAASGQAHEQDMAAQGQVHEQQMAEQQAQSSQTK